LVPRRIARAGLAALAAFVAIAVLAPAAQADNRRIAIGNYQWSDPDLHLDLGEHVTWYWVGPDTIHSVTGDSPSAKGLDSDPDTSLPDHPVGDSFELAFDAPGTYEFACKLHPIVRGTVTVSDLPGDPVSEPDPIPPNQVDDTAPRIRGVSLAESKVRHRGTRLHLALDEDAKLDAELYRLGAGKQRAYAGYQQWRGLHVGFNDVRFGAAGKHFDAAPGRYLAKLTATDRSHNESRIRKLRFRIAGRG
jgi:plastocyanin